jgi:hypothetical protein
MSDVPARLLRETLRGRATTGSSSGCVDTDMLAAWADDTLGAGERAAVESHASNCARCQALLAAMARTTPPLTPEPAREWWRLSRLGWLVPLAAAAAAVVLWINVPMTTQRERSATPTMPAAAASETSVPAPAPPALQSTLSKRSIARDGLAGSSNADAKLQARADEERPAAAKDASPGAALQLAQTGATPIGERDTAAAPSAAAPAQGTASAQIARREAAPGPTGAPSPAAATAPLASARAFDVATSREETQSKAAVAQIQIVSPDANVRWRLLAGGSVERSIDGGTIWQTQSTGALTTLTAGAAPSPAICWLVGPGGMVVLSIDGRTWRRIPIPETIDLTLISASNATSATVTAADGRTFTTHDGGRTWLAR